MSLHGMSDNFMEVKMNAVLGGTVPLILMLAGCATSGGPPPIPRPLVGPADPTEYALFSDPGELTISGQAFLTTRGGEVIVAAGRLVTLDPATTYALEWFRRYGGNVEVFATTPPDQTFEAARKTAIADAEGRFRFPSLPPGDYILRTTVTWEAGLYDDLQGGVVARLVSLRGAEPANVILNEVYVTSQAASLGVPIVDEAALSSRQFTIVAEISGESCRPGLIGPEPEENAARDELIVQAARRPEVDAIGRVACRDAGMSFTCTSRIVCEGLAIQWVN